MVLLFQHLLDRVRSKNVALQQIKLHFFANMPIMPMPMIRGDGARRPIISAFGEILGSADWADGARPPLSGNHYGLQRRCGAEVEKRSAAFGSPAELASPMRLV